MPEPVANPDPNNPQPGTDPKPPVTADPKPEDFDTSKLTDDQIAKLYEDPRLYKHSRFKELADAKKERDALKADQAKAEEDKLVSQKKFEELANKYKTENETLKQSISQSGIDRAVERAAVKAGSVDSEAVLKLLDKSSLKIDEATGQVAGIEEAITKLKEEKPYLFGQGTQVTVGNPTNPGANTAGLKRFKLSQLQDAKFYRDNEADIQASQKAGLIEDDLGH